ncbi:RNA polymerase I-specific transcription initiation factor RRN3 [Drosophila serrata]|uniref:RNA polymerase I-specific transcription initiation factor RRN3 n=1 Tax=Drosophila serrata TaxID=7274 RepID=UPI000A1D0D0D|nr:RNA polymerase I-specific transcription initiation factor RRN3 [Drosophila serrata]KAH8394037.1 hypothetical protein KR200_008510 [Drosophila serrata]
MSIYTTKSGATSILKPFSGADRERAKTAAANKVRFATAKEKGLLESIRVAVEDGNFHFVQEFTYFIRESDLDDDEFLQVFTDARQIVHHLTPDFISLVEALMSLNWKNRDLVIIQAYTDFCVDVMVTHNRYLPIGLIKLIVHWIPADLDSADWVNGSPSERAHMDLKTIHDALNRILTAVPMSFDEVIDAITSKFPYFKKPSHVTAGYLFNVLWFIEYKPIFKELILQLVLQKLLVLDVNAPRDAIDVETGENQQPTVNHPIGHTLDICLLMLYKFFDEQCRIEPKSREESLSASQVFHMLLYLFNELLLPSHNIHHVQFVIFQVCGIRSVYWEGFLQMLWKKVQNPNASAIIRHTAVGYLSSFIARAKFLPLGTITFYLQELSKWAHSYIDDSDEYGQNCSLKANMVFFSVCQGIFYLIAFRASDLTRCKKDLLFLQSLQLSRLAMCHFNPLRYCLAPVATAFAGVTRTHQLAYCHTVLERNARRKLATVYGHDKSMSEEVLETIFPFDPYLLKLSKKYIEPIYLAYHDNETDVVQTVTLPNIRKRGDSEMIEDDEFIVADKRQKLLELSNSEEFDEDCHYGSSINLKK